jgi:predicted nucleic acid-binding protein
VLADANILFSRTLRDYFIYAASEGAVEIHWSQQILDEMSRNLRARLGLPNEVTGRLEQLMNAYIEYALVDVDPGASAAVQDVTMDPGDRHVLAAALSIDADVLLTENTRHFPQAWMDAHGIELLAAGELLIRLADEHPHLLLAAHEKVVRFSSKTEGEVLDTLARSAGGDAATTIQAVTVKG